MTPNHRVFGPDYYCGNHNAAFEGQEAESNGNDCPWCGDDLSKLLK